VEPAVLARWPAGRPVRLHEEVIMNHVGRIYLSLAGLRRRAGVLIASVAAAPAILTTAPPLPPGGNKHRLKGCTR
jgi:hypothetical protein